MEITVFAADWKDAEGKADLLDRLTKRHGHGKHGARVEITPGGIHPFDTVYLSRAALVALAGKEA